MTVGKWCPSGMILSMLLLVFASCAPEGGETVQTEEDFSWLEEVRGQEAIGWAEAQNAETFARLKSDPRYESIAEQVKGMPSPLARLAPYQLLAGDAYQMLEDTEHPRGLWRRTAFGSLQRGNPECGPQ